MQFSKIRLASALGFSLVVSSAQASYLKSITFDEVFITKKFVVGPNTDLELIAYPLLRHWCLKFGNKVSYGSYDAAKQVEAMPDGLYHCTGEFASPLYQREIQIFRIHRCITQDPEELMKSCRESE